MSFVAAQFDRLANTRLSLGGARKAVKEAEIALEQVTERVLYGFVADGKNEEIRKQQKQEKLLDNDNYIQARERWQMACIALIDAETEYDAQQDRVSGVRWEIRQRIADALKDMPSDIPAKNGSDYHSATEAPVEVAVKTLADRFKGGAVVAAEDISDEEWDHIIGGGG